MSLIEGKIGNLKPRYLEKHEELIRKFAQFGGGVEEHKYDQGRAFSNVYEFYIYAFFLGLSKGITADLSGDQKLRSFIEVKAWKHSGLTKTLISCAIAESDFDMLRVQTLENDTEISAEVRIIRDCIEGFANGGFDLIQQAVADDPDGAESDDFFVSMLSA